jgi:hypothetical protein
MHIGKATQGEESTAPSVTPQVLHTAQSGSFVQTFQDSLSMPSSRVKQSKKSEDGTDSLSQTIGTKLPFSAA